MKVLLSGISRAVADSLAALAYSRAADREPATGAIIEFVWL
jgi:hypothetical protein